MLLREFPGLDHFPTHFEPRVAFHAAPRRRNTTVALGPHAFLGETRSTRSGALFLAQQHAPPGRPVLGSHERGGRIPNPATFFDTSIATSGWDTTWERQGRIMERFSFGGPNDTFNRRDSTRGRLVTR